MPGLGELPEHARLAAAAQDGWDEPQYREEAGVLPGVELSGTGTVSDRVWTGPGDHGHRHRRPRRRPRLQHPAALRPRPGVGPDPAGRGPRGRPSPRCGPTCSPSRCAGAHVDVVAEEHGHGFAADTTTTGYAAARWALATAWGSEPVDIGVGGSIPFIADLDRVMPGAAVLVTGVEDPDSRAHGTDESLHLGEFAKVCLAEALLLEALTPR